MVGVPYPKKNEQVILNYTGTIGISGARKGCIYVITDRGMVVELTKVIPGVENSDESVILDIVGELANTISGNAQKAFGETFVISVPMVISGSPVNIHLPIDLACFVLPFTWKSHKSFVVVGLN